MKKLVCIALFFAVLTVWGCSRQIAVATLEDTITQAAIAAKQAAHGASEKLSIEVTVANAYQTSVGATVPTPVLVVPISASAGSSLTQTTKLSMEITLSKFLTGAKAAFVPKYYILDTTTGELKLQK